MGSLHLRRESVSLADLLSAASGIALVRPADPPSVVEQVTIGGDGPTDVPRPPAVTYMRVFDRFVVEEWLRLPLLIPPGPPPERIEVASPSNEASARDAQDAANGMLGHVHHLVIEYVLDDVPEAWRATPDGRRVVFLAPTSMDPASVRFAHVSGGLSVGPAALEAIRAAVTPPPAPSRRTFGWWGVVLFATVVVAIALARCPG